MSELSPDQQNLIDELLNEKEVLKSFNDALNNILFKKDPATGEYVLTGDDFKTASAAAFDSAKAILEKIYTQYESLDETLRYELYKENFQSDIVTSLPGLLKLWNADDSVNKIATMILPISAKISAITQKDLAKFYIGGFVSGQDKDTASKEEKTTSTPETDTADKTTSDETKPTDTSSPDASPTVQKSDGIGSTEEQVFNKYMVGPYNPNSSMDRGKMEVVKNMLKTYENKYGKPFSISNADDLAKMQPIANAAYQSTPYKQAASLGKTIKSSSGPDSTTPALYKTKKGRILGMGGEDVYSPTPPPIGTRKYEVIDPKTGKVTQVRRATPVKTINVPKPGSVRVEDDGSIRRKSKFGGALGSLSNLLGDVGNTLKKNK